MILLVAKLGLYVSCRERESLMDADIYSFLSICLYKGGKTKRVNMWSA